MQPVLFVHSSDVTHLLSEAIVAENVPQLS